MGDDYPKKSRLQTVIRQLDLAFFVLFTKHNLSFYSRTWAKLLVME